MRHPVQWVRGLAARTPLRIKLVGAVLALAAVGLSLAAIAAATSLHSYLLDRVDQQLENATGPIGNRYDDDAGTPAGGPKISGHGDGGSQTAQHPPLPSEFYIVPFNSRGTTSANLGSPLATQAPPVLPRLTPSYIASLHGRPFTVSSADESGNWRVVVHPFPGGNGGVAIATSLNDLGQTVNHLILVEVLIGAVVLVLMGGGGYLLIRRSLRPLVEVEHTAAAIAAGDLSQRVPQLHPRTEVGRLSGALNSMLAQVENAFTQERTSQQQARASEDRMRRFVADASHELRTPLTSIRGFAELHRMGAAPDEADVKRLMRRVEDEAARMGLLVEDLLLLARLDQQRPLEQTPVDLLEIASDVVHDAQVVAPTRAIALQVRTVVPPVVRGDEPRLRQVLHNLMTNAIAHTPDGTPVTVILSTYDGAHPRAVIEVADAGPGLTEHQAGQVFERFYRTDDSRSRTAGGTGLGLSIVAGIVAAHGGRVTIDSQPGDGAIFGVELPLISEEITVDVGDDGERTTTTEADQPAT
jgi:two-component system OmpR family sensor kinase